MAPRSSLQRRRQVLLACSVLLAVGVTGISDEGWDDDEDEARSRTSAPFEVDGEVRHDWGQDNLREWDGAVFSFPSTPPLLSPSSAERLSVYAQRFLTRPAGV